jgi:FkbM family methyltransferase
MTTVIRKLLSTESEWNPKVMAGRVITRVLPESTLHALKKHYYRYLLTHMGEDWVESDASALPRFISAHDHVVDIGANLGVFSRFLARLVGPRGRVYAFEPIPQTFDFLCENIRKLRLPQVQPLPFALSDREHTESMVIPTYRWGAECWYDARMKTGQEQPGWREIQVECRTLDSFQLPKISFIKCDANFHELAVLRGGIETIRRYHPVMLIEVNPNPDHPTSTAGETFALLQKEGYMPYILRNGNFMPRQPGERSQNYFFLPSETRGSLFADAPSS